jgi:hypothetical protein
MRWSISLLIGLVLAQTGCSLGRNIAHNLVNEPRERYNETRLTQRIQRDSRQAWNEYCHQFPNRTLTDDFAEGFRDGYADYLQSGGTATAPAVPPLRYRRTRYLSPQGHAQVHEYMNGVKAGLESAAISGRRQYLTVPVLIHDPAPEVPLNVRQLPGQVLANTPSPRVTEPLPTLRSGEPHTSGDPGLTPPTRPVLTELPSTPPARAYSPRMLTQEPDPATTDVPLPTIPTLPTTTILGNPVVPPPTPDFERPQLLQLPAQPKPTPALEAPPNIVVPPTLVPAERPSTPAAEPPRLSLPVPGAGR